MCPTSQQGREQSHALPILEISLLGSCLQYSANINRHPVNTSSYETLHSPEYFILPGVKLTVFSRATPSTGSMITQEAAVASTGLPGTPHGSCVVPPWPARNCTVPSTLAGLSQNEDLSWTVHPHYTDKMNPHPGTWSTPHG